MSTKEKIRELRLTCPIIHAAYAAYPNDEDEAIRVALLAHFEHSQALMLKLVNLISQPHPVFFGVGCSECGKPHPDHGVTCSRREKDES